MILALWSGIAVSQTRRRPHVLPPNASKGKATPTPTPASQADRSKASQTAGTSPTSDSGPKIDFEPLVQRTLAASNLFSFTTTWSSINPQPDGSLKVWVHADPLPDKMPEIVQDLRKDRSSGTFDVTKFHSKRLLYHLRCAEKMLAVDAVVYYDADRNILWNVDWSDQLDWTNVIPGTVGESVLTIICANRPKNQ
jgi:hypothetical protein